MNLRVIDKMPSMQNAHKIIVTAALLVITLSAWFSVLDAPASKLVDEGFKRALVSFATARALNSAISAVQGTEVAVQVGVGITFTPGQLLDPVNDLVENFSDLMMTACIALGVQKFLISIGDNWFVSFVLTIFAMGWGWFYFRQQQPFVWLPRIFVILLMIRFTIPVVAIGTDFLFKTYLNAEYTANQQAISQAPNQVTMFKSSNTANTAKIEDMDWWERAKNSVQSIALQGKEALDFDARVKRLEQLAENWTEHIVNLIIIFLLQTLVIPVLLIWVLYFLVKEMCYRALVKI